MAIVRSVSLGDVPAVRRVLVDTWHDTYDAELGVTEVTAITDDWHSVANLERETSRRDHAFMLAEVEGEVVATGSATRDGDAITLARLYVHPTRQRHGVGTTLLDALLAHLGPATRVELQVADFNAPAIAFYEKAGFVAHGHEGRDLLMQRRGT